MMKLDEVIMIQHNVYSLIFNRIDKLINVDNFMNGVGYLEKGKRDGLLLIIKKINADKLTITEYFDLCGNPMPNFEATVKIDIANHKAEVLNLKTEYGTEESYKNGVEKPKIKKSLNRFLNVLLLRLLEIERGK